MIYKVQELKKVLSSKTSFKNHMDIKQSSSTLYKKQVLSYNFFHRHRMITYLASVESMNGYNYGDVNLKV